MNTDLIYPCDNCANFEAIYRWHGYRLCGDCYLQARSNGSLFAPPSRISVTKVDIENENLEGDWDIPVRVEQKIARGRRQVEDY